jgi:XrtJ-associated TM-motif-TM protein
MMKRTLSAAVLLSLLLIPALAHAQSGCVDSPENPTALLAVVGSLGGLVTMLRRRR